MRDNCCYHETTMLAEDRVSSSVPSSVYTRINDPDGSTSEDPFDAENERHYGFSHDNSHVINTTKNVVVLPSFNKWNCFSNHDPRTVDVIITRDNMNSAAPVNQTSTLFNEKATDYPVQASRSSGNDLASNSSAYRKLTLREKLAKQRSQRENDENTAEEPRSLTKATSGSNSAANYHRSIAGSQSNDIRRDGSCERPKRLTKTTSLGGASTPPANYHRPATRSQSNSSITEEKTVFGFKVMKGTSNSSDSQNSNRAGFNRHGSSRQPSRTTSNSTPNRFSNKTGNTLFYTPKNNRVSETLSKSKALTKHEVEDGLKGKSDSFSSSTKIELTAGRSCKDVDAKSSDSLGKGDDSSNVVNTTTMNISTKGRGNICVKESTKVDEKPDERENIEVKDDPKTSDENFDNEVFKVSKEIEVKNEVGKTEKRLIRGESLREGKSRLEEFREKQKRGKLTRSLTNPDFKETESTAVNKGKNISESLAEIRERIRDRRRKKEQQLKKSKSVPNIDTCPEQEVEEEIKEFSDDAEDNLEKSRKAEMNKKGSQHGGKEKQASLNDSEYLQIEENSEKNGNEQNLATVNRRYDDSKAEDKISEKIITKAKKEEVQDTRGNELLVMDTKTQTDNEGFRENGMVIPQGKKVELKEILSNRKDDTANQARESTVVETKAEPSLNSTAASSEQSKSEVKKPTKRERRKHERYQRSKTMSSIMYDEISLEARREKEHKGNNAKSGDKDSGSFAISPVSEIKKKFAQDNSVGNSKRSELGLFYSGTTPASKKYSRSVSLISPSKTAEKAPVKDDSATDTTKTSGALSERNVPRAVAKDVKITNTDSTIRSTKNTDARAMDTTAKKAKARNSKDRRHTLPNYTTEISIQCKDVHSPADHEKKEVAESGSRLPVRRHTFCSETSFIISRYNPVKFTESVGTLREKFSKGVAPVFNLATSSNVDSAKSENHVGQNEQRNDSSVRRIIEEAKNSKDTRKDSGSSLTRRHTIANGDARQHSKKDEDEKQEFLDRFLAKDEEINTSSTSKENAITQEIESNSEDGGQNPKHTKNEKEGKAFLGQPSHADRKTKRREQRAKTIAGGTGEVIMKELAINDKSNVLPTQYVVKPNLYVTDTTQEEAKEGKPERRRRTSDLNPDNYLSSEPLLPKKAETDSVFSDEKASQSGAQSENTSSKVSTAIKLSGPVITSARRRSISDSEIKITSNASVRDENTSEDGGLLSSDAIDLRTPTETNLSTPNSARRRSGSESDMKKFSGNSGKDQCLDDYLSTAIKTLTDTPRPPPQKEKFTASQSFDQSEERCETKQHLDVSKTNLRMHSWSTSDLDKIFYGGNGTPPTTSQADVSTMDFDEISSSTTRLHSLTENRTRARPKRTSSKSINPMKSLMERTDVRSHTEEPQEENKSASGFEKAKKRSTPRKKRSQMEPWRRHTLDPVALAALAGREDFSRVSLRKTKGPGKEKDEYSGSLPVMLLQIKGRRQVQTRLVEPSLSSLNSGDCFLLVTSKELFCWIGHNANTIEKAKAVEISSKIQKRRDMDCKTGDVLYIDEAKQGSSLAYRKFCKILGGETDFPIEDAKLCPDDEFYEREVISTNKVYKLQEGEPPHLMPITEMCGYMPRIGILNTKEVFVFDFGSELYVWTGQQSLSNKRKVAFHLAEMLYEQRFDCEGVVSPINPRRAMKKPQSSQPVYHDAEGKECGRPKWTLFAKLHEKAETLLFREKFFDWPDPTKIIKMKGHVSSGEIPERPPPVELKPCDPIEMQKPAGDLEPAILEATNLGRGLGTPNVEVNGEVKEGDMVTTTDIKVWLVTQNRHFVLPKTSEGHFHSGHGYVIRWVYFVAKNRIVRDRRGRVRQMTGRQRCAYFFWQGNECSVNEKGAAAIMAVELDEEHGPQVRVVEGKEPPHFLKLFDGAMVIHSGKRTRAGDELDDFSDKSTVRMYCIRNEDASEGCLVQVKRSASSLRSRSSFVVVDAEQGSIFVWHGCKTNEYHRASAEKAANFIKESRPMETNLSEEASVTVTTVEEGQESELFWLTVNGKRKSYLSLLNDPLNYDFCPRLFHMTSATGQFTSTEILNPSRYPDRPCSFPVLQDDLYSASQPATFLLDGGNEVYVWEGWMPSEITKDKRGSAKRRWDEERKLTLQTALSYVEEVKERITKGAHVVQAGLEPPCFTTHFPFWNRRQDIVDIQYKEGKKEYEKKSVEDALDTFKKKFYSIQQLTSDNPPDGVDPSKLETYLSDEEFEKIFEMSRDLFGQLPGWKQDILKKAFGLF